MGSASRIALDKARGVLSALPAGSDVGAGLLQAAAQLGGNNSLLTAVADAAVGASEKEALIDRVFAPASESVRSVLKAVSSQRWSNEEELVAGVEELGIRGEALKTPDLADELLAIDKVISSDNELELTLDSKLGLGAAKADLAKKLFAGKVSESALAVVSHLVANPAGRRIGKTLQKFANLAADQNGKTLATVTLAAPLDEKQMSELETTLAKKQGRAVQITSVIDPSVIGGMRIRIADEVIDATVKSRLDKLKLQLSR